MTPGLFERIGVWCYRPGWGPGDYVWFIGKNVVGWLLIMISWPVGLAFPGPGGIPLFVIGFALITFPGKRRLTARVLHGVPVSRRSNTFRTIATAIAILIPAVAMGYLGYRFHALLDEGATLRAVTLAAAYLCGVGVVWLLAMRADRPINWLLRRVPPLRRRVRPWLRRKGLDLLPPRRRRRYLSANCPGSREPDEEILEIHARHQARLRRIGRFLRSWSRPIVGVAITALIFWYMFRPVVNRWAEVRERIAEISWINFALAAAMFAIFLFVFRVISWWGILRGFGHHLPLAPATRIWSTSELARYLPGVIWQVVGRVMLVRPYGVSGSVCSTSQLLELVIFLLANIVVAISCLLWLGTKLEPELRPMLIAAMALVPVLLVILHPRVFYGAMNRLMDRLGKPRFEKQLNSRQMFSFTAWAIVGLLWQSLAIWLVLHQPLGLELSKWWVVAGAYCLAWCAGFLAVWAPGGIGVRELVLVLALRFALPAPVRAEFADEAMLAGFLAFLGVLLRLWATAGELILASIAYTLDYRGAINHPNAPGRVARETSVPANAR